MSKDFMEFRKSLDGNYNVVESVTKYMTDLLESAKENGIEKFDDTMIAKIAANSAILASVDLLEFYHNWLNNHD